MLLQQTKCLTEPTPCSCDPCKVEHNYEFWILYTSFEVRAMWQEAKEYMTVVSHRSWHEPRGFGYIAKMQKLLASWKKCILCGKEQGGHLIFVLSSFLSNDLIICYWTIQVMADSSFSTSDTALHSWMNLITVHAGKEFPLLMQCTDATYWFDCPG